MNKILKDNLNELNECLEETKEIIKIIKKTKKIIKNLDIQPSIYLEKGILGHSISLLYEKENLDYLYIEIFSNSIEYTLSTKSKGKELVYIIDENKINYLVNEFYDELEK